MPARLFQPAAALIAALAVGACSVFGGTAAPEPDFTVVRAEPPFEVRDYPELVLARTAMADGTRAAFGRLFDYISGENGGRREIAMTAPVIETEAGAEIAMTAPVLQDGGAGGPTEMGFVLPAEFTAATAPLPADPAVTLAVVPARRVATIRFSGSADPDDVAESRVRLEAWMAERGLAPAGAPELAQYNPPWTISALRRNELLIPVAER